MARKIKRGTIIIFIIILIFLVLPSVLINLAPVQKFIVDKITVELSEKTGTTVSVDKVRFRLFNSLSVNKLYVEDLNRDTLIFADEISLRFSPIKLFRKKILINEIAIDKVSVNLVIDTLGVSNMDILKNIFTTKRDSSNTDWLFVFQINDIQLTKSKFSFVDLRASKEKTSEVFDSKNIRVNNINGQFLVYKIDKNYYKGRIKNLSFEEQSGFRLKKFQTAFLLTDSTCLVQDTKLNLPNSRLTIDSVFVNFGELQKAKPDIGKIELAIKNLDTKANVKDFDCFDSSLSGLDYVVSAQLSGAGHIEDIFFETLRLSYGSQMGFVGNARIIGLPDIPKTYISSNIINLYGSIPAIQDLIANINKKPYLLPKELIKLNKFAYNGKVAGYLNDIKVFGKLSTEIGDVETNLDIKSDNNFEKLLLEGRINTSGLNLAKIMPPESGLSSIVIDTYAKIKIGKNIPLESDVNAKIKTLVYQGYTYNNVELNGQVARNKFEGYASIDDENGKLNFHGLVDLSDKQNKAFFFDAVVKDFKPHKLSLIKDYPNLELNFNIRADFTGDKIDNINGNILLDSIYISNNRTYKINKLYISSKSQNDSLVTLIESDIVNGYISGQYSFAKLPTDIISMVHNYIPVLKTTDNNLDVKHDFAQRNSLGFYVEIEPLKDLCNVLEIPWTTTKQSTISGFYNGDIQMFNLELEVPQITNGILEVNSTRLNCYNDDNKLRLIALSYVQLQQDSLLVAFNSDFENDAVNLLLAWKNFNEKNVIAGEIFTQTRLSKDINNKLNMNVDFLPTQIVLRNQILDVNKSSVFTDFNTLKVNHFAISGDNQSIKINGAASKLPEEHISIHLEKIDMGFISSFLPEKSVVSFGGIVTGRADISKVFDTPDLDIYVESDNFMFNDYPVGYLEANSYFNHNTKSLDFEGTITTDSTNSIAKLHGKYFPGIDSLILYGDIKNQRLQLVKKFVDNIFSEVDGYGTGKLKVAANLKKEQTTVETKAAVQNGRLKIDILGAEFFFSDTITLTRDSILFSNVDVRDHDGNYGKVSGYVSHKYLNKDIKYKIDVSGNNTLMFNKRRGNDIPIYGQAYATGFGTISGTDFVTNVTYNATTEPNTKIYIPLSDVTASTSSNFISFVGADSVIQATKPKPRLKNTNTEINTNINLNLNVNPNAQIQLLIDERAGDMIKASGDGILTVAYNSQTEDFNMYGTYTLTEGKYRFVFQQVIEREFRISAGSTLLWNGDPQNPIINLRAIYQTKASIKGLFDQSIVSRGSGSIPVNCVLNLTGNLTHPNISFDIELPGSNDDVRRALKNLINTDEMMNRQIIYLLAFNRFYNPNAGQTTGQTNSTSGDVLSIFAATLGNQLNGMLAQLSDKFTIGLNIKLDQDQVAGTRNNEYGVNINFTPNDRIVINSNLGYREEEPLGNSSHTTSNGWNNAILDFELEYRLDQSGRLAAKVYNRTNSIQDFKDSPYTQGLGLVYQESFNSIRSLIAKYRKKKKETTDDNSSNKNTSRNKEATKIEEAEKTEKTEK